MSYQTLHTAASTFVSSTNPKNARSPNSPFLLARSPSCQVYYPPATYGALVPRFQHPFNNEDFNAHIIRADKLLARVRIELTNVIVDVEKRSAAVWSVHCLTPKGEGRQEFRNEFVWMLDMDVLGEMVEKAVAFVDRTASVEFMKELADVAKELGVDGK